MVEVFKFLGVVLWIGGAALFVVEPLLGVMILLIALLFTLWVLYKDREKKHAELIKASQKAIPTAPPHSPSVSDRLAELDSLKEAGTITDEEYEVKRQDILGSL